MTKPIVIAVIPAYKSGTAILEVISGIPKEVSKIIVVDDCCPDGTGELVKSNVRDSRVEVIKNGYNLGVGGAAIVGFKKALILQADVVVKIDSDGQMDPKDIPRIIEPVVYGYADYAKGNRFNSLDDLQEMPKIRLFGNAALSIMSKMSTGYWSITDPTNGFFAISRGALEHVSLEKLRSGWFFESDMLFRLAIIRAAVVDVPVRAKYGQEKSNLKVRKVVFEFLSRHAVNFLKRVIYVYYLREWSIASFELPAGLALFFGGIFAGLNYWADSYQSGLPATTGQVMLAALPIILGFQMLLSVLSLDAGNEPRLALYSRGGKSNR